MCEPQRVGAAGQHVTYEWDDVLSEWWINDARGLEHGYQADDGAINAGAAYVFVLGPAPAAYCTAGTTTNGCVSAISGAGTASASAGSGFSICVNAVEGQKPGLLFYGITGAHTAPWGGGSTSFLCVKAPTQRLGTQSSGGTAGACDGAFSEDWNAYLATHAAALGQPFAGGETAWAQAWFRDPPAPKTTNLSYALAFTVAP